MTSVYGGLFLENLVDQDKHFTLQCLLFQRKLIQGIQLRVAHPSFTTPELKELDVSQVLARLPNGMKIFIHYGSENVGNDFGCRLDERGEFARRSFGSGLTWRQWNLEALRWGANVAKHISAHIHRPGGVVHPGYGFGQNDNRALLNIVDTLSEFPESCALFALENVPAEFKRSFFGQSDPEIRETVWIEPNYWGFGGTPEDMSRLIDSLNLKTTGSFFCCLIDFSHLFVTANQASTTGGEVIGVWKNVGLLVGAFLDLPHSNVCHFSGLPPTLTDNHSFLRAKVNTDVRNGIQLHDVVCLEIPFANLKQAESDIGWFRENYLGEK